MAPPQFSKIGSKVKDLFSKKYDYHNNIKVTNKTDGLTIEAGGNDKSGDFNGNVVVTHKNKSYGETEVTLDTSGKSKDSKVKFKFNKFQDGMDATVSSSLDMAPTVEMNHKTGSSAVNAKFTTNGEKHSLSFSATYGVFDALTLGGSFDSKDFSSVSGVYPVSDADASLEYTSGDVVVSAVTKKFFSKVGATLFQKWTDSLEWGASITLLPEVSDLTVGAEYKMDKSSTVKAKAATNGVVGWAIEHKLKDPNFKLNLASEFDINAGKSTNFGVGLSFGDY
jgi:hypothetical protein